MRSLRPMSLAVLACAVGLGAAACGSSSPSSNSSSTSAPASSAPATSAPASSPASSSSGSAAAASAIAADWAAFFDAKTPDARRVALLQDGSQFATVIKAMAGSGLASEASAKVTRVTVVSPTEAKVTYSILVSGQPALSNQTGTAIYQGGTWKVGVASFCGLLALENGGSTKSLPPACKTAS